MLDAIELECRKVRALVSTMRLLADDVQTLEEEDPLAPGPDAEARMMPSWEDGSERYLAEARGETIDDPRSAPEEPDATGLAIVALAAVVDEPRLQGAAADGPPAGAGRGVRVPHVRDGAGPVRGARAAGGGLMPWAVSSARRAYRVPVGGARPLVGGAPAAEQTRGPAAQLADPPNDTHHP